MSIGIAPAPSSTLGSRAAPWTTLMGPPKLADRPLASAANFALSTWLMANSTMNSTISSVTMSA